MKRHAILGVAVTVGLTAAVPGSWGQIMLNPPAQQPAANPDSLFGKDPTQGVYVSDSAIALEKFTLASRMEKLREWDKSADVYQEVLEKYPDRVVPSQTDKDNKIYQYTSVAMAVQERLAKWPAEGLNVYRRLYEPRAAAMLESAQKEDYDTLHRVYMRYFATDSGRTAGLRLLDLDLESGEFAAAAWIGDRLLALHPNLMVQRPIVLYRTAVAYHLAGNQSQAQAKLDELKQKFPNATGTIRGKDVVLADALAGELQAAAPVAAATGDGSWPMFGGSPDRGRISTAVARPGARLYSIELARQQRDPRTLGGGAQQIQEQQRQDDRDAEQGKTLGLMPVVDRGELFFQDGRRIYAVSLDSGVPLPGWAATYGSRNGQYESDLPPGPRTGQLTLTLTDAEVLAILQPPDPPMPGTDVSDTRGSTKLVCLDRKTGKPRWTVAPAQLPEKPEALRALNFSGSPLVIGDNVFVIARGGKGNRFVEDCYVMCLDRASGAYRWACYVASSSVGDETAFEAEVLALPHRTSHLAYANGRLYVLTNLGALAALDAYNGTILWLNIYPRDPQQAAVDGRRVALGWRARMGGMDTADEPKPWAFNPVVVQDGRVFVMPTDANHLLVYDAGSGVELKRIHQTDLKDADTLLGVLGSRVVVAGDSRTMCLDWQKYDPTKFGRSRDEAILWESNAGPNHIRGRGFVTTESLFLPTDRQLRRIDMRSGKVLEMYPRDLPTWAEGEGAGNVLVAQDHVVIAGDKRVTVYTDLELAKAKLDREVAAAPNDPEPRLRYAEIMFAAGYLPQALDRLDEAIGLLGGQASMQPGAGRDHVFADALLFAQKLAGARDARPETMELTEKLFDRAGAAATSPEQFVNYHIARARSAHTVRDYVAETKLYQQILLDPRQRAVAVPDEDGGGAKSAAAIAEEAIAALIKTTGGSCYAAFDQDAAAALQTATAAAKADQLQAVAQAYPNAKVAPKAMLAAAELYEKGGNPRQATQVLRQVYAKYRDLPEAPAMIEAMARNYLAMPNRLEVAVSRLSIGARRYANPMLRGSLRAPDGKMIQGVSFAKAADLLREYQVTALPDFHLPEKQPGKKPPQPFLAEDQPVAEIDTIVPPLRPFERYDRLVAWSRDSGLSVYPAGKLQPLATSKPLQDQPTNVAWQGSNLVVWSDSTVALLQDDGRKIAWKLDLATVPTMAVTGRGEKDMRLEALAPAPGQVVNGPEILVARQRIILMARNRAARLGAQQAGQAVPAPGGAEQIVQVQPAADRVLIATSSGRILAIDSAKGSVAWQARLTDRPIQQIVATDDFVALRFAEDTTSQLAVLDTLRGQMVGRLRRYPAESAVQNMALAADGTLVFTLPDRLCGKDLYDPGDALTYEVVQTRPAGSENPYQDAREPDQLVISDGRILALSDSGGDNPEGHVKVVRIHSLETGQPIRYTSTDAQKETDAMLVTDARDWNVHLRAQGPFLYVMGQRTLSGHNLDRPGQSWQKTPDSNSAENFRDMWLGRDYVMLLDAPDAGNGAANAPTLCRVDTISRSKVKDGDKESGLWVHNYPLRNPSGITQWQAVDGGLYYLAGDRTLHLLRGARP